MDTDSIIEIAKAFQEQEEQERYKKAKALKEQEEQKHALDFLANSIKALRKQRGYTQQQLAEKAGISRNSIIKYENGDMSPSVQALQLIAMALGVSISALVPNYSAHLPKCTFEHDNEEFLIDMCEGFANYLRLNNVNVLTCSNVKLIQLFAAFIEEFNAEL